MGQTNDCNRCEVAPTHFLQTCLCWQEWGKMPNHLNLQDDFSKKVYFFELLLKLWTKLSRELEFSHRRTRDRFFGEKVKMILMHFKPPTANLCWVLTEEPETGSSVRKSKWYWCILNCQLQISAGLLSHNINWNLGVNAFKQYQGNAVCCLV